MKNKLRKKQQERDLIVEEQRKMLDKLEEEKREDFDADEQAKYEKMDEDYLSLTDDIADLKDKIERQEERQKVLEQREFEQKKTEQEANRPDPNEGENRGKKEGEEESAEDPMYRQAFRSLLKFGPRGISNEEYRALQADLDPSGGFVVAPEQFVKALIKELANTYWVRQFANVISVPNAASLGMPVRQAQMGDPEWTAKPLAPRTEMCVEKPCEFRGSPNVESRVILSQAA